MEKLKAVLLILLLFGLMGCAASKPYVDSGAVSNPNWSKARNIVKAAGLRDIVDVSPEWLPGSGAFSGEKGGALGATTFAAVQYLSDLNQLGLASIPMSIMSWNATGETDRRTLPALYAWMPEQMASSSTEAINTLGKIVREALQKGLEETQVKPPYAISPSYEIQKVPGVDYEFKGFRVSGGMCDSEQVICRYDFPYTANKVEEARPYKGIAPDFLGHQPSWLFIKKAAFHPVVSGINRKANTRPLLPDLEVYLAMSKHLPEWAYLYLPNSIKTRYITTGKGTVLNVPLILHRGEVLMFVKN